MRALPAGASSHSLAERRTRLPLRTSPPKRRLVQDVHDSAPGVRGWMAAKGAFDRGDLQWAQKEEEARRFVEQDMQEKERAAVSMLCRGLALG